MCVYFQVFLCVRGQSYIFIFLTDSLTEQQKNDCHVRYQSKDAVHPVRLHNKASSVGFLLVLVLVTRAGFRTDLMQEKMQTCQNLIS